MAKELTVNAETECLKLKKAINENHHLAQRAYGEALERGVLSGELLLRWKELLPHGRFESFTETHFDGSLRTARTYMQAAKYLNSLPNRQRTAVLKQERSIAGLISHSDKGKPGGVFSTSSELPPASPGPASGEAADSPAGGSGHGAETQHQAGESRVAHPSAGASGNLGKCPNCAGAIWDEDDEGWACAKCHHPHGEPAGDVDKDRVATQRQKTVKTAEALLRAFDDLNEMLPRAEHDEAIRLTKAALGIARKWK
uniref:Uncharacterized protein n=1 Tax=viral metagenome TaxID=1070528 RepID=A0A6M3II57_9ZZZZ